MGQASGWTLGELATLLGGNARGSGTATFLRPVPAGSDDPQGVTFAESDKYLEKVLASGVGAVIVSVDAPDFNKPAILVESPRLAFFRFLALCDRPPLIERGTHPSAIVHESASIAPGASIGANVVIAENVVVEDDACVFPLAYVGPRCRLSKGCKVMAGAVLVQDVVVGSGSVVLSGAVLGADGFGFVWDGTRQVKVPQVGGVVIGPNVEIGANTTIDRATSGETQVGEGVKIDDLVHVGHNTSIGKHSVIAGQVGISGSVTIGERVIAGGQVAFADHVNCADDVVLAGRTGLMSDLNEPGEYYGVPPMPIKHAMRILALQRRLPELLERIKQLEEELERLKSGS